MRNLIRLALGFIAVLAFVIPLVPFTAGIANAQQICVLPPCGQCYDGTWDSKDMTCHGCPGDCSECTVC